MQPCNTNRINYTSHFCESKYALTRLKILTVEQLLIQISAVLLRIFRYAITDHSFNLIGIMYLELY